jgi:hypothetical protein
MWFSVRIVFSNLVAAIRQQIRGLCGLASSEPAPSQSAELPSHATLAFDDKQRIHFHTAANHIDVRLVLAVGPDVVPPGFQRMLTLVAELNCNTLGPSVDG